MRVTGGALPWHGREGGAGRGDIRWWKRFRMKVGAPRRPLWSSLPQRVSRLPVNRQGAETYLVVMVPLEVLVHAWPSARRETTVVVPLPLAPMYRPVPPITVH